MKLKLSLKIITCIKYIYAYLKDIKKNKIFFRHLGFVNKILKTDISNLYGMPDKNQKLVSAFSAIIYNLVLKEESLKRERILGNLLYIKLVPTNIIKKIIKNIGPNRRPYLNQRIFKHPNTPVEFLLNAYKERKSNLKYILSNPNLPTDFVLDLYKNMKQYKINSYDKKRIIYVLHEKDLLGLKE